MRRAAIVGAGFAALLLAIVAFPALLSWGDVRVTDSGRLAIAAVLVPVAGAAMGVATAAAFGRLTRGDDDLVDAGLVEERDLISR